MVRGAFIESILMEVYGQKPSDDAEITYNLVNLYLSEGIGVAAQAAYKGAIQLDGIGYVNNGFYATFSGINISQDDTDNLTYKFSLPEVPVGIGASMGVAEVRVKSNGVTSKPMIPVSINQWAYFDTLPSIPNKTMYLQEGKTIRIKSVLLLTSFTATVKMISGGDANDLNSELNVPPDYLPVIREYVVKQLLGERSIPTDSINDGVDQNLKQI